MDNKLTLDFIEKAKQAKSAEELLSIAKENGAELTEEESNEYFALLNEPDKELFDDELDDVVGGVKDVFDHTLKPCGGEHFVGDGCNNYKCRYCNTQNVPQPPRYGWHSCSAEEFRHVPKNCFHCAYAKPTEENNYINCTYTSAEKYRRY